MTTSPENFGGCQEGFVLNLTLKCRFLDAPRTALAPAGAIIFSVSQSGMSGFAFVVPAPNRPLENLPHLRGFTASAKTDPVTSAPDRARQRIVPVVTL